jgi:hypothetical protein
LAVILYEPLIHQPCDLNDTSAARDQLVRSRAIREPPHRYLRDLPWLAGPAGV